VQFVFICSGLSAELQSAAFSKTSMAFQNRQMTLIHYNTRCKHLSILLKNFICHSTNGLTESKNQKSTDGKIWTKKKRAEKPLFTDYSNAFNFQSE